MRRSLGMAGGKGHKMVRQKTLVGEFDYIPKQWFWRPPPAEIKEDKTSGWSRASMRTGVLARKVGMSCDWSEWSRRYALTYLQLESCHVVGHKTDAKHGYNALQIGFRAAKPKHVNKPQMSQFEAAGIDPLRIVREFRITADAFVPIGSEITAQHFVPGQKVSVRGETKGKGFAGVMKRWNFKGGNASHGASKSHRQIGSTGSAQDPGHVIKGKKMPGRLGGVNRTCHNLTVFRVVPEMNMIAVIGHVPGSEGGIVEIWDSNKKWKEPLPTPPFPAYIRKEGEKIFEKIGEISPDSMSDLKGPMPMPWRLQVAQQAGWHIPSPAEVEEAVKKGKIYHIAAGGDEGVLDEDEEE